MGKQGDSGPVFGVRVRAIREGKGISQAEAARQSGMLPQSLAKLERGATNNPTLKTIRALAAVLGVSPCELIV